MALLIDPITLNLTIYKGATFRREFIWKSGPTKETVIPVDLTGCTACAQVRETHASATTLVNWKTSDGSLTLGDLTGTIRLELSATATAALPTSSKPMRWDLEIYWPGGEVTRLFEGTVMISPEVTRD